MTEEEIKQKFLEAFNSLLDYRDELIENCRLAQKVLCECSDIDTELDELHREIEVVVELSTKAIYENAHVAIDQEDWLERNNGYLERHRKAVERVAELEEMKREWQSKNHILKSFIRDLKSREDRLNEFDDRGLDCGN